MVRAHYGPVSRMADDPLEHLERIVGRLVAGNRLVPRDDQSAAAPVVPQADGRARKPGADVAVDHPAVVQPGPVGEPGIFPRCKVILDQRLGLANGIAASLRGGQVAPLVFRAAFRAIPRLPEPRIGQPADVMILNLPDPAPVNMGKILGAVRRRGHDP